MKNKRGRTVLSIIINVALTFILLFGIYRVVQIDKDTRINNSLNNFNSVCEAVKDLVSEYLYIQQQICNNKANFINEKEMSIDEAIEYLRNNKTDQEIECIIYIDDDNYSGFSTYIPDYVIDNNSVSFAHLNILRNIDYSNFEEKDFHLTKNFVNPLTNNKSFAVYHPISIHNNQEERNAVLMRVIEFEKLYSNSRYINDKYKNSKFALVDLEGNYIINDDFYGNNIYTTTNQDMTFQLDEATLKVNKTEETTYVYELKQMNYSDNILMFVMSPFDSVLDSNHDTGIFMFGACILVVLMIYNILIFSKNNRDLKHYKNTIDEIEFEKQSIINIVRNNIAKGIKKINIINKNRINNHKLDQAKKAVDSLSRTVNNINDYYSLKEHQVKLNLSTFNISESFDFLPNLIEDYVRKKDLKFNFYVNRLEHEILIGDEKRIKQVLYNALLNAFQYCEKNSTINVEIKEEIGESLDKVRLIFTVNDDGIGMSDSYVDKMYKPFYRDVDANKYNQYGSGLGLSLCKELLELMNGTIERDTCLDKGSKFVITLQLEVGLENIENTTIPSKNALVLSNDPLMCQNIQETLFSIGVLADTSTSIDDVYKSLETVFDDNYDVIIIDGNVLNEIGADTLKSLKYKFNSKIIAISVVQDSINKHEEVVDRFIYGPMFRSKIYLAMLNLLS